ncbi:MAG: hypothetical protein QOE52_2864 [Mycobacterium sp.]|nr:hypothetical protein [Mycobacterium sp.]
MIPTVNANCVLGLIECPAGRGSRRERARVQGKTVGTRIVDNEVPVERNW